MDYCAFEKRRRSLRMVRTNAEWLLQSDMVPPHLDYSCKAGFAGLVFGDAGVAGVRHASLSPEGCKLLSSARMVSVI